MKIYLDYIFLENLVINILIIRQLTVFVKVKVSRTRKILISSIISIYTTLIYIYSNTFIDSNIIKLFVIIIAIYLLYKPKKLNYFIKLIILYYLISFLYVGIIISITIFLKISLENIANKLLLYICSGFILDIFVKHIWKIFKSNIKDDDLIYTMYIGDVSIKSFVDTGNNVRDNITNLDVIFLNKNYYENLKKEGFLNKEVNIYIQTVIGKEKLNGYIVENVKFYHNSKYVTTIEKIIISFTLQDVGTTEKYSALINYNTYIENLKGVTI